MFGQALEFTAALEARGTACRFEASMLPLPSGPLDACN